MPIINMVIIIKIKQNNDKNSGSPDTKRKCVYVCVCHVHVNVSYKIYTSVVVARVSLHGNSGGSLVGLRSLTSSSALDN